MAITAKQRLIDLFVDGFVGTRHEVAAKLGIKPDLAYKYLCALKHKGVVVVVSVEAQAIIWAFSGRSAPEPERIPNVGIVQRAVAARPAIHLWACGQL